MESSDGLHPIGARVTDAIPNAKLAKARSPLASNNVVRNREDERIKRADNAAAIYFFRSPLFVKTPQEIH